jgi:HSP20 family molecular chaperone IbpA
VNDLDLEDKALEQLENLSEEEVSMIDAKSILAELLDRNKETMLTVTADLPGKQDSEIDIKTVQNTRFPV